MPDLFLFWSLGYASVWYEQGYDLHFLVLPE